MKLLEVKGLKKYFPVKIGLNKTAYVKAIDGVDLTINKGETLGLVGESGSGKSTTGMSVLRLIEPTEGSIYFEGKDISKIRNREMQKYRKDMQIVFQDPFASLNPRWKIGKTIGEALEIHKIVPRQQEEARINELLDIVGLPAESKDRYPHEFSGGQRQRIGIARALAVNPKFIVCDEPVSALDVSVQAQIINLLHDLKEKLGLSYLFIAHDLGVVRQICDKLAVMYLGKIVEVADTEEIFMNPKHPYTKALLSAVPVADPLAKREEIILSGEMPNPMSPPTGCAFRTRCIMATDKCVEDRPELRVIENDHQVSCHFVNRTGGRENVQVFAAQTT
jgi:oligopeptide transport system ATP-binding protein